MPKRRGIVAVGGWLVVLLAGCSPDRTGLVTDAPAGDPDAGARDAAGSQTSVFAHTATALYRVDPDSLAITKVADFAFADAPEQITDIAIDRSGLMIGISFASVYRIDPATAVATRRASGLIGNFNGLSFVPAEAVGLTGDDVLVATRNLDGTVSRIDPQTGTTSGLGDMRTATSSGDLVSVAGLGTLQTADTGLGTPDLLVQLAPGTFAATPIGTSIGFADIWGVAYWGNRLLGFTNTGDFITIDLTTGVGTLVQGGGPAWWGAAVTTRAPVSNP